MHLHRYSPYTLVNQKIMTKPLILVTAATGKTGMAVVKQLLEKGRCINAG